jgi:hypothetical protein
MDLILCDDFFGIMGIWEIVLLRLFQCIRFFDGAFFRYYLERLRKESENQEKPPN